jgi:hypothetical protein
LKIIRCENESAENEESYLVGWGTKWIKQIKRIKFRRINRIKPRRRMKRTNRIKPIK